MKWKACGEEADAIRRNFENADRRVTKIFIRDEVNKKAFLLSCSETIDTNISS